MNELTFISSFLCVLPAAYIVHKIFHLNKGITQYTQQIHNLNNNEIEASSEVKIQPNLTLIRCQRCPAVEPSEIPLKVVSGQ